MFVTMYGPAARTALGANTIRMGLSLRVILNRAGIAALVTADAVEVFTPPIDQHDHSVASVAC